ncbi:MAG: FAD-dependent oxidoreductase [Nocardioidaceae bacterium]|nr:FAD-dependent oxidoreductase [Nocardioidaceae bacterium]
MRVAVAGAGIVGLTCAWWLAEAGYDVRVFDPAPGEGATYAAAGMLAPAGEAWFGEEDLLRLGLASAALWPAFGRRIGVRVARTGTVLAGFDAGDVAVLARAVSLLRSLEVPVSSVTEPVLSDRVAGTAFLPGDAHVNPRSVVEALLALLGDRVVRSPLPAAPAADVVVRCTGAAAHPSLRPVRGEILRVRCTDPPRHMVRGLVRGEPVYLVPRFDGEVVVGATSESLSDQPAGPTVGGVLRLLDAARSLVPSLDRAEVLEVLARDRPGSPDNGPLIGFTGAGELLAAGHGRGGVLLAPITAAAVLAHVAGDPPPPVVLPFSASRFQEVS